MKTSVNRISLGEGTPFSFVLGIVVDNCNREHSPLRRIEGRGETADGEQIEPDTLPELGASAFNGIADLYQFRYDGFGAGDFIKIKLNGESGKVQNGGGASFGGVLFDLP